MTYHNLPPGLAHELREIKKRLRIQENAGLGNISVGNGGIAVGESGRIVFGAGSEFQILAPDGTVVLHAGALPNGDYGIEIFRQTGEIAMRVAKQSEADDDQVVALYDNNGRIIFSDALLSPDGADAPFLSYDFRPVTSLQEITLSAATYTDLFAFRGRKHNAFMLPTLQVRCSDGTTAGQIKVVDRLNGDAVLSGYLQTQWTGTIAAGTTTNTEITPPFGLQVPGAAGADVHLVVQARRTAGTGTISVAVVEAHGVSV